MAKESKRRIVAEFAATNKAKGAIAGFTRDLTGAVSSVRRLAGATLALAGIGGIGYLIKQQMAAIDATAKLSDRLDVSTQSLIALQHAAKIAGVEKETLNKSLEILTRRLGEVNMGVGQAKYALDSLGLSADELAGKSTDEAIGLIADQLNKLPNAAQKAAAANYLFGRSGQQLLNLFEEGSAGIDKYRAEVERLGLAYDRVDAAKVEAANDAMERLGAVMRGAVQAAVIELSPYVEALADHLTDAAISGAGLGVTLIDSFEKAALAAVRLGEEIEYVAGMAKRVSLAHTRAITMNTLVSRYEVQAKLADKELKKSQSAWTEKGRQAHFQRMQEALRKAEYLQTQIEDEKASYQFADPRGSNESRIRESFDKYRASVASRQSEIEAEVIEKRNARRAGASLSPAERPGIGPSDAKADPTASYFAELDREMDMMRTPSMDSINVRRQRAIKMSQMENVIEREKIANGEQLLAQYEERLRKLQRMQELEVMARGVGDAFGDAMQQFITRAKSAEEAIKDLVAEIAQLVLRQAVIQPVANAISSGIMSAAMMHDGGTVGRDGTPVLADASLFTHAPSFKSGRRLGSDEFAAILHKDEEVIPKNEQSKQGTNIGLFFDPQLFQDFVESEQGTKVMLRWTRRNRAALG